MLYCRLVAHAQVDNRTPIICRLDPIECDQIASMFGVGVSIEASEYVGYQNRYSIDLPLNCTLKNRVEVHILRRPAFIALISSPGF